MKKNRLKYHQEKAACKIYRVLDGADVLNGKSLCRDITKACKSAAIAIIESVLRAAEVEAAQNTSTNNARTKCPRCGATLDIAVTSPFA